MEWVLHPSVVDNGKTGIRVTGEGVHTVTASKNKI